MKKYKAYSGTTTQRIITSQWYIFSVLLLISMSTTLWIAAMFGAIETFNITALATLITSITGAMIIISVYGSSHFTYRKPPKTTTQLLTEQGDMNVALASEHEVVKILQTYSASKDKRAIYDAVSDVLTSKSVQNMFKRMQLNTEHISKHINDHIIPSMSWKQWMNDSLSQAAARGREYINIIDVAGVLLLHPAIHKLLRQYSLREKDIEFVIWWQHVIQDQKKQKSRWWDKEKLLDFSGVGLSWAAGYTPLVDQFAHIPRGNLWDVPYGHVDQVEQLINTLARRSQSNVLLVGQPGVGRLGVVREIARRVRAHQAHPELNGKRIIYIHIGELMSFGSTGPEQLSVISRALDEMEHAGNVIAVLDGVSSMLARPGGNQLNLTDALLPFFSSQTVRVVVIMSSDEYHLRIKTNEELLHLFEIVHVPALDDKKTLQLLALTVEEWEKEDIFVPYQTLREIIQNTVSILPYLPFPEKAFDILEEVLVAAQGSKKHIIAPQDINDMLSRKLGIDIGKLREGEQEHLLQIENIIHRRVVNQKIGVSTVARAMIRARAGVRNKKRPIGTFLFLGPTGVGKTETAKALAEAYFGAENYMQRLDMSEFQGDDGIAQLIGDSKRPVGRLTSMIADHPFSVLLFGEFEKAGRAIQQIFLPVFDEGYITDARNRRYSFTHSIMIATSNAGAEFIRTSMQEDGTLPKDFDETLREYILSEGIFRPEVLNRFDAVVTFAPLTREHVRQIAQLMLRKLNKQLDVEHGITIRITDDLLDFLAKIGYNPEFGARPMARAIADTVEYAVAQMIIRNAAEPGQEILLNPAALAQLKM